MDSDVVSELLFSFSYFHSGEQSYIKYKLFVIVDESLTQAAFHFSFVTSHSARSGNISKKYNSDFLDQKDIDTNSN